MGRIGRARREQEVRGIGLEDLHIKCVVRAGIGEPSQFEQRGNAGRPGA
jgi:hypothetical protein